MLFIHRQYARSARQLAIPPAYVVKPPAPRGARDRPGPGLNRAVVQAVNVGRSIATDVSRRSTSPTTPRRGRDARALGAPGAGRAAGDRRVAVPGARGPADGLPRRPRPRVAAGQAGADHVRRPARVRGASSWWERILYNQSAKRLRTVLLGRPHTVVVDVPYRREEPAVQGSRRPTTPRRRRERPHAPGRPCRSRTCTGTGAAGDCAEAPGGIVTPRDDRSRPDPTAPGVVPSAEAPRPWPTRRHRSSGAPSWRSPAARPTGRSWPSRQLAKAGQAELVGVHVVEIDWTLPLDADVAGRSRTPSASSTSPRPPPRPATTGSRPCCSRRATSGRRSSTRPASGTPTCVIAGLPFRRRFGGDFAIGRTIPYILKNAPCAVWVVREAMPEEQA